MSIEKGMKRPLTPCVACFSRIDPRALICPRCQSYQKRWKNSARYYASIVGLVTLGIAVAAYVGEKAFGLYTWFTWEDRVNLMAFESFETGLIRNSGDGRVTVTTMTMMTGQLAHKEIVRVNKEVERGQTVVVDVIRDSKQDHKGWAYLDASEAPEANLLQEKLRRDRHNYVVKYHHGGSVDATMLRKIGKATFRCCVEVEFLSSRYEEEDTEIFAGEDQCAAFIMVRRGLDRAEESRRTAD